VAVSHVVFHAPCPASRGWRSVPAVKSKSFQGLVEATRTAGPCRLTIPAPPPLLLLSDVNSASRGVVFRARWAWIIAKKNSCYILSRTERALLRTMSCFFKSFQSNDSACRPQSFTGIGRRSIILVTNNASAHILDGQNFARICASWATDILAISPKMLGLLWTDPLLVNVDFNQIRPLQFRGQKVQCQFWRLLFLPCVLPFVAKQIHTRC